MMWWWSGNGYWGHGWWWPGVFVMAAFMVLCMAMMARMMRGATGCLGGGSRGHNADGPERVLADRLARGEIDVEEYERLLAALRPAGDPGRTQGAAGQREE